MLRRLTLSRKGNMALMMAGVMGAGVVIIGSVIDYMSVVTQKHSLQGLADHAALAAARELIVSTPSDDRMNAIAASFVKAGYTGPHTTSAELVEDGRAVKVSIEAEPKTFFPSPFANGVQAISAEATAEVSGGGYVCMVGLDVDAVATLNMMNRARLTAENCAVYSNSTSAKSLWVHDFAKVSADVICVAGGFMGSAESFLLGSAPVEDCPQLDDPLRDRPAPEYGSTCDYKYMVVKPMKTVTLRPGVYCGGLTVLGGTALLDPGVYIIKGGQLTVAAGGRLLGENAGFYLTGPSSTVVFGRDSEVSLTAPKTGDMAGLLFFEDREKAQYGFHQITSRNARNLVGTMYFPKSKLLIDANNPVADRSDYTIIIAKEFELREGPELVLNTDYASSQIPVPEGVGDNTKATIRLVN
jgi:Flp pilus assembly protein TadG